jgi:hypothetical protein
MQILLDEKQRRSYERSLREFEDEERTYVEELQKVRDIIRSIRRKLGVQGVDAAETAHTAQSQAAPSAPTRSAKWPVPPQDGPYAQLSMRSAILRMLENPETTLSTNEITHRLLEGGLQTTAIKPDQAVSACLSSMCKKRGEIDYVNGKYKKAPDTHQSIFASES